MKSRFRRVPPKQTLAQISGSKTPPGAPHTPEHHERDFADIRQTVTAKLRAPVLASSRLRDNGAEDPNPGKNDPTVF